VKPLVVQILTKETRVSADKNYDVECRTSGSRPEAVITWWKANKPIKKMSQTVSAPCMYMCVCVCVCVGVGVCMHPCMYKYTCAETEVQRSPRLAPRNPPRGVQTLSLVLSRD